MDVNSSKEISINVSDEFISSNLWSQVDDSMKCDMWREGTFFKYPWNLNGPATAKIGQKCWENTDCCGYLPWSLSSLKEHTRIAQRGLWPDPHGLPSSLWLLPYRIFLTCCNCCCLLLADTILKLQNTSENDPWHQLFCLAAVPLQTLIQWYHNIEVSPKEKTLLTLNCWTGFTVIPEFLGSCLKNSWKMQFQQTQNCARPNPG